CLQYSISPYSF
nr:immunoglobulin light chain junction region [Macaca mulatta]MOW09349.1 immunoglobulin light chain junction region [Macaca mulatta]MOW09455.1 immunoglobulin light chain junction region [Macaca mulatta]MOW09573.1 immunoglobulin light chain junction region [Macaca mulatta]MOW09636.1 immunoglobulin light chain junction region [Macaca mulatta]